MRVSTALIAICVGLIAGTAGAATYLALGFNAADAFVVAIAVLTSLGLFNAISTSFGLRASVSRQLGDSSRTSAAMARQVAELDQRLARLENRLESGFEKTHTAVDPLLVDVDEMQKVVNQLSATLAHHQAVLKSIDLAAFNEARAAAPPRLGAELQSSAAAGSSFDIDDGMVAEIRAALDSGRLELYLQPIVTLPERNILYYDAIPRFRSQLGELLPAAEAIAQARGALLSSRVDNLALTRCVQVVRRLLLKDRQIAVFCNISMSTLRDDDGFTQLLQFLEANRALARSIVLGFAQTEMRDAGSTETDNLARLAERGFRFCMQGVIDLGIEPHALATGGFRFVKIPVGLLLKRASTATASNGETTDLADLLVRFEIDVIAEQIEDDETVVELIDRDIRFGQGGLFSPPRPVRAQALESVSP